ncbi:DUF1073 domain-containing protein [Sessilibacter corallicola]|uniref:DUF1073 domain-containing protein n=1 Tax=Sessilibacter corallicola TaxID=2904075 RepID=UPI001E524F20|nr:DUF1073 domain-containing protein [Sessilibacter corallicola]MCE2029281.1 DUF1073 domain-containing protein [Sessilibacter corallicola]
MVTQLNNYNQLAKDSKPRTRVRAHMDGLRNVVSGMIEGQTKRSNNRWAYGILNDWHQLDAAYQESWIASQIVDVPAKDMTREWRRIKCQDAEEIQREEKRLCVMSSVQEAVQWGRLFGGGGILMLTGQDLGKPLKISQVKKGDLQRLLVFDRFELGAHTLNTHDVLARNYLKPEFYTVWGGQQQIHHSHVVRFEGYKLPRRQLDQTNGWGDSVLRRAMEEVTDAIAAKNGIAELMHEANIDTITREGLADALSSEEDEKIQERYQLFKMMKSIFNLALLDGDETMDRMTLNLSGVAPVLETLMIWISGAAKIPVTKLFGTSAKGMNATGEGDLKTYYDDIRSHQTNDLEIPMRDLDEVMVRSALGDFPDDFDYEWNPLAQPNELETAQAGQLRAQTHQMYMDMNVASSVQVKRELQAQEHYQYDDDVLAAEEKLLNEFDFTESEPGASAEPATNEA